MRNFAPAAQQNTQELNYSNAEKQIEPQVIPLKIARFNQLMYLQLEGNFEDSMMHHLY
jgi:hypothetical protein